MSDDHPIVDPKVGEMVRYVKNTHDPVLVGKLHLMMGCQEGRRTVGSSPPPHGLGGVETSSPLCISSLLMDEDILYPIPP